MTKIYFTAYNYLQTLQMFKFVLLSLVILGALGARFRNPF